MSALEGSVAYANEDVQKTREAYDKEDPLL